MSFGLTFIVKALFLIPNLIKALRRTDSSKKQAVEEILDGVKQAFIAIIRIPWLWICSKTEKPCIKEKISEIAFTNAMPSEDICEKVQFGYDIYRLINYTELTKHRKRITRHIFDIAFIDSVWEGGDYKRQFAEFAFHYYSAYEAITLLFPKGCANALYKRYKSLSEKYSGYELFDEYYRKYSALIKPVQNLVSFHLIGDSPLLDKCKDLPDAHRIIIESGHRHNGTPINNEHERLGYLALFNNPHEFNQDDWGLIFKLYCEGDILYDIWDYFGNVQMSSNARKKISDFFTYYWNNEVPKSSTKLYNRCKVNYIEANNMTISTNIKSAAFKHRIRIAIGRMRT